MARFKMEMSGTWEIQQCLDDEYADRMDDTLGERKRCWKSDPLIVLRARESRVHGEAAGPRSTCRGSHSPYPEMD